MLVYYFTVYPDKTNTNQAEIYTGFHVFLIQIRKSVQLVGSPLPGFISKITENTLHYYKKMEHMRFFGSL